LAKRDVDPVVRVAPYGELRLYSVSEDELEILAQGSPSSTFLNFSLSLLPMSIGLYVTLFVGDFQRYGAYVFSFATISFLGGLVCSGGAHVRVPDTYSSESRRACRRHRESKNRLPLDVLHASLIRFFPPHFDPKTLP
jgi:hypothetical protein